MNMPHLFDILHLRDVVLPNRISVSPMCEYSCTDGMANDWHFVHLGSRAVGGAGLIFTEAAAVVPEGRISPEDLGVWSEAHFEPLARIAHFVAAHGGAVLVTSRPGLTRFAITLPRLTEPAPRPAPAPVQQRRPQPARKP